MIMISFKWLIYGKAESEFSKVLYIRQDHAHLGEINFNLVWVRKFCYISIYNKINFMQGRTLSL